MAQLDRIDQKLLMLMQGNASLPQRELAERVGLSQNACWRRIRTMEEAGYIAGRIALLNREALGVSLVVFTMIRTRHHSREWLQIFRKHVSSIPEVVDFYRIAGDYDYLLKVVTYDMSSYDAVYRRLIEGVELDAVTSYFGMEAIEEQRPIELKPGRS